MSDNKESKTVREINKFNEFIRNIKLNLYFSEEFSNRRHPSGIDPYEYLDFCTQIAMPVPQYPEMSSTNNGFVLSLNDDVLSSDDDDDLSAIEDVIEKAQAAIDDYKKATEKD